MKAIVRIIAQYSENVAFGEGGECWKPKGAANFEMRISNDYYFNYCAEHAEAAIRKLIEQHNNQLARYEYISHEILFDEPTQLSEDAFNKLFNALIKRPTTAG